MPETDKADCTAIVSLRKDYRADFMESMAYKLLNFNKLHICY